MTLFAWDSIAFLTLGTAVLCFSACLADKCSHRSDRRQISHFATRVTPVAFNDMAGAAAGYVASCFLGSATRPRPVVSSTLGYWLALAILVLVTIGFAKRSDQSGNIESAGLLFLLAALPFGVPGGVLTFASAWTVRALFQQQRRFRGPLLPLGLVVAAAPLGLLLMILILGIDWFEGRMNDSAGGDVLVILLALASVFTLLASAASLVVFLALLCISGLTRACVGWLPAHLRFRLSGILDRRTLLAPCLTLCTLSCIGFGFSAAFC